MYTYTLYICVDHLRQKKIFNNLFKLKSNIICIIKIIKNKLL